MESTSALRQSLRDLYEDYAVCLDEMELEQWPDFFTEDAVYRVTSMENHAEGLELSAIACIGKPMIRDRVAALRATTVYEPRVIRHQVSCLRINGVDGDRVSAQANFALFESLADREPHLLMTGRYIDQVVRRDGALKFAERLCVYDNYRVRTSLIIPV